MSYLSYLSWMPCRVDGFAGVKYPGLGLAFFAVAR
jgi:hypothetical protein